MKGKCCIAFLLAGILMSAGSASGGPHAPAAGQPGSTAIHMDNSSFIAWATGWQDYIPGTDVDEVWQTPERALGKAAGDSYDIVCLGRGGEITMTFDTPITDGAGYDFAVFENSVSDTFLELAYVEVSADGISWYRFANESLTASPVAGLGNIDPTDVYQLGSKYRQGYGEPYDLAALNLAEISYVRILDIAGDGTCYDSSGHIIYDPYPTVGSAGFDLDAIGVINQTSAPVPLPPSCLLFLPGLMGMFVVRLRRIVKKQVKI